MHASGALKLLKTPTRFPDEPEFNRAAFNEHYNKRQNVESTMMMIKSKFGDSIRNRTPTARKNEVYCKVLCHNICCLIQSMYELGIDSTFSKEMAVA